MKYYLLILFSFWKAVLLAQTVCLCPTDNSISPGYIEDINPTKIFPLNSNISIGLCGNLEESYHVASEPIYVESFIFDCNSNKEIYSWSALQNCSVELKDDTLLIKEYYLLPIGKKTFKLKWEPFYVTNIYLQDSTIKKEHYFVLNKNNYTTAEINSIINNYNQTTDKTYSWNSEKYLDICYQLFWCYVSGEEKAYDYLQEAGDKFGSFGGAVAEQYLELLRTIDKIKKQ